MLPRDPETFAQAQAALDGAQVPFHAGAVMKVLWTMLADGPGCDAVITEHELVLHDGGAPASRCILELAPGVICKLLELAGARSGRTTPCVVIEPMTLTLPGAPFKRSFSRRRVWFHATPTQITIAVRDALDASDAPRLLPASLERPITFVEIEGGCPHCGVRSATYRELSDGGLVCGPCGRSFTRTVELPVARLLR